MIIRRKNLSFKKGEKMDIFAKGWNGWRDGWMDFVQKSNFFLSPYFTKII